MKHLTITLLTLLMSMKGLGAGPTSVSYGDDGGWLILLAFLGFWILIGVYGLLRVAKETIEEKIEFKKKERLKKSLDK